MSGPLGVIVPARDEAAVIRGKLEDLAAQRWPAPPPGRVHRLVVVDDHSADGTAEVARAALARAAAAFARASVEACVLPSAASPGKPGAIRTGLAAVAGPGGAELIVLTDADVRLGAGALAALAAAFERDPRLGMACGAQRYEGADGRSDMGPYDRAFALLRRVESRFGALLSVHGQLLAWRAALDLAPPDGQAADDLWLVVAARDRPGAPRVELVPGAVFQERRAAPGAPARAQALRRARAWFQHFSGPAPRRRPLRWQWRCWRAVPALGAALTLPLAPFAPGLAERRRLIREARRAERAAPLAARWEVARG